MVPLFMMAMSTSISAAMASVLKSPNAHSCSLQPGRPPSMYESDSPTATLIFLSISAR